MKITDLDIKGPQGPKTILYRQTFRVPYGQIVFNLCLIDFGVLYEPRPQGPCIFSHFTVPLAIVKFQIADTYRKDQDIQIVF